MMCTEGEEHLRALPGVKTNNNNNYILLSTSD